MKLVFFPLNEKRVIGLVFLFLLKINLFYQISLVLNQVILALISCHLSIIIYRNLFMEGLEVRNIFFYISKAFDKVWYDGINPKPAQYRKSGNPLILLVNLLIERKQRIVLNRQSSTWTNINVGVPSLFLIHINDLTEGLSTSWKLFAGGNF